MKLKFLQNIYYANSYESFLKPLKHKANITKYNNDTSLKFIYTMNLTPH